MSTCTPRLIQDQSIKILTGAQGALALQEFEPGITLLDTDELKKMIETDADMLVVNTLAPILFRDQAISGSVNIPYENLKRGRISFPDDKNKQMVFYCLGFQ
ncbi:MAG: rhodanese-like domain-containing protein [bacterium]|nr:rhodanese-like domain-containing protein [bacterium]MDT8366501.1 rhodanese-like domain-containing protein [bacterium]